MQCIFMSSLCHKVKLRVPTDRGICTNFECKSSTVYKVAEDKLVAINTIFWECVNLLSGIYFMIDKINFIGSRAGQALDF
jgi:hypothetical protein